MTDGRYRRRYVLGWLSASKNADEAGGEPEIDKVALCLGKLQDGLKVNTREAIAAAAQFRFFQETLKQLKRKEDRKPPTFDPPFHNPYVHEKNYKERVEKIMNEKDKEIIGLRQKLSDVTLRLNAVLGSNVAERQLHQSDLKDPYRPIKVTEYFRETYEKEWPLAYEELKPRMGQANILVYLGKITWRAFEFCKDMAAQQMSQLTGLETSLLKTMARPSYEEPTIRTPIVGEESVVEKRERDETRSLIVLYRKSLARSSLRGIRQIFLTLMSREPPLPGGTIPEGVKLYIQRVVELVWLMVIQEPPMELEWVNYGDTYDQEKYKPFSNLGRDIVVTVWPAVLMHKGGPVMTRGVVELQDMETFPEAEDESYQY